MTMFQMSMFPELAPERRYTKWGWWADVKETK